MPPAADPPGMKTTGGTDAMKRRAGERAAAEIEDGQVVGLGTGSTAAYAIRAIGERVADGAEIVGVPTSYGARQLAIEVGIPLTELDRATPDVAIDGADQVADGNLIKGGGAAHAREKVVDAAADDLLVVADPSKESDALDRAVPVEVLPDARAPATDALESLGAEVSLRPGERKDGPVVTDNGNVVLDCAFGAIAAPDELAAEIAGVPGTVAHGLFVDLADRLFVGTADGVDVTTY